MVKWKTSVNPIYISNHDNSKMVCEIKNETGEFIEKERQELPEMINFWRGFYKNNELGFIGVFASNIGPILFINQTTYPLIKGGYDVKWLKKGKEIDKREFFIYYEGKEIYKIEYDEVKCLYINPYEEDEEFRDFYMWMYKNKDDDNFYNFYMYSEEG